MNKQVTLFILAAILGAMILVFYNHLGQNQTSSDNAVVIPAVLNESDTAGSFEHYESASANGLTPHAGGTPAADKTDNSAETATPIASQAPRATVPGNANANKQTISVATADIQPHPLDQPSVGTPATSAPEGITGQEPTAAPADLAEAVTSTPAKEPQNIAIAPIGASQKDVPLLRQ